MSSGTNLVVGGSVLKVTTGWQPGGLLPGAHTRIKTGQKGSVIHTSIPLASSKRSAPNAPL